jgi:hypothetical protein
MLFKYLYLCRFPKFKFFNTTFNKYLKIIYMQGDNISLAQIVFTSTDVL